MPAGQLRESVTFQRLAQAVGDGAGNYNTFFADIPGAKKVPADLQPIRAAEVVLAQGIEGRRVYEAVVRYSPTLAGIQVQDRMIDARDSSRVFNVIAPPMNKDKHRKYLHIMVEQGGATNG